MKHKKKLFSIVLFLISWGANAQQFDGIDDKMTIPFKNIYQVGPDILKFRVVAQFSNTQTTGSPMLLSGRNSSINDGFFFAVANGNKMMLQIAGINYFSQTFTTTVYDNNCHLFEAQRGLDGKVFFWLDGKYIPMQGNITAPSAIAVPGDLTIGADKFTASFLKGSIQSVKMTKIHVGGPFDTTYTTLGNWEVPQVIIPTQTFTDLTANHNDAFFGTSSAAENSDPQLITAICNNILRDPDAVTSVINGIDYKYYQGTNWSLIPNFATLTPVSTGQTNTIKIDMRQRPEDYGFVYQGYMNITASGTYTFYTSSDDGSQLYIGDRLVVNNDGLHAMEEKSGAIGLKAGKHAFTVKFFQKGGGDGLDVSYEGPGISKQRIPDNIYLRNIDPALLRTPQNPASPINGVRYQYYEGTWNVLPDFNALTAKKSGIETTIRIDQHDRTDHYGFVYTGYIQVPADNYYTFYTNSDDGSQLLIGNTLVVNNDGIHAMQEKAGTIGLKAGLHAYTVKFFEKDGGDGIDVSYESPVMQKQRIPNSAYFISTGARESLAAALPANTISVYPNPFDDSFKVLISNTSTNEQTVKVALFNTLGVEVYNSTLDVNKEHELPVTGSAGIYIGKVTFADGSTQQFKMIKR